MRISTTNPFLTKTLRTLCCVGALTACSAWATVVNWQPTPLSAASEASQAGYTSTARGFGNMPSTDASLQYSFRSAPQSTGASETSSTLANSLKNKTGEVDVQQQSTTAFSQSSTGNTRPDDSLLFASNTSVRPATELDEAMAKTFDEEFVSVPTVQFAATAPGSQAAAVASMASMSSGPGPVPVPEMSALFPIIGLIAAVSCTQILRRRRAAQQSGARIVA